MVKVRENQKAKGTRKTQGEHRDRTGNSPPCIHEKKRMGEFLLKCEQRECTTRPTPQRRLFRRNRVGNSSWRHPNTPRSFRSMPSTQIPTRTTTSDMYQHPTQSTSSSPLSLGFHRTVDPRQEATAPQPIYPTNAACMSHTLQPVQCLHHRRARTTMSPRRKRQPGFVGLDSACISAALTSFKTYQPTSSLTSFIMYQHLPLMYSLPITELSCLFIGGDEAFFFALIPIPWPT